MSVRIATVPVKCDAAGAATVYSGPIGGELIAIRVAIGTLTAGAVDLTFTDSQTGLALLTVTNLAADATYYPRAGAVQTDGSTAITNSFVNLPVAGAVKVVVAQGGNATSGTVYVWYKR